MLPRTLLRLALLLACPATSTTGALPSNRAPADPTGSSKTSEATDPQGLVFLNSGVVRSNETFEMVAIGRRGGIADGSCMEMYAYRQVMSNRNMATQGYTAGGPYQYLYRVERNESSGGGSSPPAGLAASESREQQQPPPPLCAGCNALGQDFKLLEDVKTLAACVDACVAAGAECCQSFTWSPANKVPGGQGCYLKSTVGQAMQCGRPKAEVSGCSPLLASGGPLPLGCNCTTGPALHGPTDHRPAPPQCHLPPSWPPWPPPPPGRHTTPPSGMRSALPLGTFGQTVELRADGTLADWRGVFNNGPEGGTDSESGITVPAAKVDIDDAVFAVFVNRTDRPGGAATRFLVRTHPPRASNLSTRELEGVAALEYSGSFPVARLRVLDDSLPVSQVKITATSPFFPEHSNADWMSRQSSSR
jgi:hypothetical protein